MRRCCEHLSTRSQFRNSLPASFPSFLRPKLGQARLLRKPFCLNFSNFSLRLAANSTRQTQDHHVLLINSPSGSARTIARRGHTARLSRQNRRTAEPQAPPPANHWVAELEKYLPRGLSQLDFLESRTVLSGDFVFDHVLQIILRARNEGKLDVLAFMVLDEYRYEAVIQLVDVLLKPVAFAANEPFQDELPSNINWPDKSFAKRSGIPIELERGLHSSRRSRTISLEAFGSEPPENDHSRVMQFIWSLLAHLVTASGKKSPEEGKKVMHTVHQILARIHELGLVPAKIYSHHVPRETVAIQQPPTLHLLSSKILSTLSDAVWRAYRDEVTAKQKSGEKTPWKFFPEPPGSPLRSKGRELGPEVWVEFILWCCVEAGFASTGAQIIKSLREDVEDHSWRAVRWADATLLPTEQYELTRFAILSDSEEDVHRSEQHNVISGEVVLSLVDCLINELEVQRGNNTPSTLELEHDLGGLLSFLEPSSLTPAYIDYLAVRLLQNDLMHETDNGSVLYQWSSTITRLRELHSAEEQHRHEPGLEFDFILDRSELQAGLLHQTLQVYIEKNLAKKAVNMYTDIQKTVDGNKLRAIGEFLTTSSGPQDGFFTSRPDRGHNEFLDSYGQLPTYKVVPFLDLTSRAKLFGLADWLLYSDDVDGRVLPVKSWEQPSVAAALTRYATAKNDPVLLGQVSSICTASKRKITVSVLRALAVSYINAREWGIVARLLQDLSNSEGGGYSPLIVATLAASILRMGVDPEVLSQERSDSDLAQALLLLSTVLDGFYLTSPGTFRNEQKKTFRLQVGYLLRLLENLPDDNLPNVASRFRTRFPISNEAKLATETFNELYNAVIEICGVLEGQKIWRLFCKTPGTSAAAIESPYYDGEDTTLDTVVTEYDEDEFYSLEAEEMGDSHLAVSSDSELENPDSTTVSGHVDSNEILGRSDGRAHAELTSTRFAVPALVDVNEGLQHDPSGPGVKWAIEQSELGDEDTQIPFEGPIIDSAGNYPELTPIVDPDVRTLQILVRGIRDEIKIRQKHQRSYTDLRELLLWAEKFYASFGLTAEDIATEFRASATLPHIMKRATKHRNTSGRNQSLTWAREKARPDVSREFSAGALRARFPGAERVQDHAGHIFGDHQDANEVEDAVERPEERDEGKKDVQALPGLKFRMRKFGTTAVNKPG